MIDGQLVRLEKPIDELAAKFIRVRLTAIPNIDLRRFEFDCDLTWYVFLLNSDETIYGRYGGRDAAGAESRLSLNGLYFAMTKALVAHRAPPQAKKLDGLPVTPEKLAVGKNHKGCIHCHNVKEFERADALKSGTWTRESLAVYPLPENLGFTLSVDIGNRVKAVSPASLADTARLKTGDSITTINGYPIASFADAAFALHKSPWKGKIPFTFERNGVVMESVLELPDGWKKTNLSWRPSLLEILPSVAFSGDELSKEEKTKLGLNEKRAAFRQSDPVHYTLAKAGIRAGDIVIGFDSHTADGGISDLLGIIRRNYLVGDTVVVHLLRDGKAHTVKLTLK